MSHTLYTYVTSDGDGADIRVHWSEIRASGIGEAGQIAYGLAEDDDRECVGIFMADTWPQVLRAAITFTHGTPEIRARLEELRAVLRLECISYGELAELQGLAPYIDPSDVELLEAAGVPEH